jgi:predicted secreted acid phosphatase
VIVSLSLLVLACPARQTRKEEDNRIKAKESIDTTQGPNWKQDNQKLAALIYTSDKVGKVVVSARGYRCRD